MYLHFLGSWVRFRLEARLQSEWDASEGQNCYPRTCLGACFRPFPVDWEVSLLTLFWISG